MGGWEKLRRQRRALEPTVAGLGLAPGAEPGALAARLAVLGLEVAGPPFADGQGVYYAMAAHRRPGGAERWFVGRGRTAGEALCLAAAAAFAGEEEGASDAPAPEG